MTRFIRSCSLCGAGSTPSPLHHRIPLCPANVAQAPASCQALFWVRRWDRKHPTWSPASRASVGGRQTAVVCQARAATVTG